MRRLGRWLRRAFTAVGILVVVVIGLLLVVGNPLSGGSSPAAKTPSENGSGGSANEQQLPSEKYGYDDGAPSMAEQLRRARQGEQAYREYEAQHHGPRAEQAAKDQPLLRAIVSARQVLDRCGINHAEYGVPDYSSCAAESGIPAGLSIMADDNSYAIQGTAGAAVFSDTINAQLHHDLTCDSPGVGACDQDGHWTLLNG